MEWRKELAVGAAAGLLSTVLAAGVISAVTFFQRDRIHDWLVAQDPTCAEPGRLVPLGVDDLEAQDSSGARDPSFGAQPSDAVDGYAGSWWVPDLADARADTTDKHTWHVAQLPRDPARRTLDLDLGEERRVRLVCVVNGLAESRTRYLMHGTVSSVTVWGDDADPVKHSLERLPAEQMQTFQEAGLDLGRTASVHLQVDAVTSGETVTSNDPDDCFRDAAGTQMDALADGETPQRPEARGCLRAPAPYAGIAEVIVYVTP